MSDNKKDWLPPGVYSRWCMLFPNVSARPSEFYELLHKALESRKIPKIEISRVLHKEGGLLSANREYLRMSSERLVFDVCAAPFGTGFFISYWFTELPLVNPVLIMVCLIALASLLVIFIHIFGFWLGTGLIALGVAFLAWHTRAAVGSFLGDLDSSILKIPWIGSIYQTFFRRITFYRIDTTEMYLKAVDGTIMQAVEEFTAARGVKPLTAEERKPLQRSLYRN